MLQTTLTLPIGLPSLCLVVICNTPPSNATDLPIAFKKPASHLRASELVHQLTIRTSTSDSVVGSPSLPGPAQLVLLSDPTPMPGKHLSLSYP